MRLSTDNAHEFLPHQIETVKGWEGPAIAPPIAFIIQLPNMNQRSRPYTDDERIELHWWACMLTHLEALMLLYRRLNDTAPFSRAEKAHRDALALLRGAYGSETFGAVSAGCNAAARFAFPAGGPDAGHEIGWWAMALQTSFGLLCTTAMAAGKDHPRVERLKDIYSRVRTGAMGVFCDNNMGDELVIACTGTEFGTMEEKLEQWAQAAAEATEGAVDTPPDPNFEIATPIQDAAVDMAACAPDPVVEAIAESEARRVADEFGITVDAAKKMMADHAGAADAASSESTARMFQDAEALRPKVAKALARVGFGEASTPEAMHHAAEQLGIGEEKRRRLLGKHKRRTLREIGDDQCYANAMRELLAYWDGLVGELMTQETVDKILEPFLPEFRATFGLEAWDPTEGTMGEVFAGAVYDDEKDTIQLSTGPWSHWGKESAYQECQRCRSLVSLNPPRPRLVCPECPDAPRMLLITEERYWEVAKAMEAAATTSKPGRCLIIPLQPERDAACGTGMNPKPKLD